MEILGKILGSPTRVKIMRLFLMNRDNGFSNKDIAKRSRGNSNTIRRELKLLASIGFIKKRAKNYFFNSSFKYAPELETLLVGSDTLNKKSIGDNFKKVGQIKLLIVSGRFIKEKDSRLDLLIVGDKMKKNKVEKEIRKLEAEIGSELLYAVFNTKDFLYRLDMYDKLVRDVLDFPHEIVLQAKELNLTKVARHA